MYPGQLREGVSVSDAPDCDVDTPCPDGLECSVINLDQSLLGPICIDPETACDLIDCGDGQCVSLESYPSMITCSSDGGGDGDGDGDDPVCSDGECSTPPGGSEAPDSGDSGEGQP
jgi:hypothetical protein